MCYNANDLKERKTKEMKENQEVLLKLKKKEKVYKKIIVVETILMIIVILWIGIGIFRISKGISTEREGGCDLPEAEILNFNQKFIMYEGMNVRGSDVNSLLNRIVQNNVSNQEDTSRQIKLTQLGEKWQEGNTSTDMVLMNSPKKADIKETYTVLCKLDKSSGLVSQITIESN